eukprot:EG_transcript_47350
MSRPPLDTGEKSSRVCTHWMAGGCHFGMRCKFTHPLCLPNGISILDGLLDRTHRISPDIQVDGKHASTSSCPPCDGCAKLTRQCASLEYECDDLRLQLQVMEAKGNELQTCLKRERFTAALWAERLADCQSE